MSRRGADTRQGDVMATKNERARRRLERDDLLQQERGEWRMTRRLQGATARAAMCLAMTDPEPAEARDLRRSLAVALVAIYGPDLPEDVLLEMIEVLLAIDAREVELRTTAEPSARRSTSAPTTS